MYTNGVNNETTDSITLISLAVHNKLHAAVRSLNMIYNTLEADLNSQRQGHVSCVPRNACVSAVLNFLKGGLRLY